VFLVNEIIEKFEFSVISRMWALILYSLIALCAGDSSLNIDNINTNLLTVNYTLDAWFITHADTIYISVFGTESDLRLTSWHDLYVAAPYGDIKLSSPSIYGNQLLATDGNMNMIGVTYSETDTASAVVKRGSGGVISVGEDHLKVNDNIVYPVKSITHTAINQNEAGDSYLFMADRNYQVTGIKAIINTHATIDCQFRLVKCPSGFGISFGTTLQDENVQIGTGSGAIYVSVPTNIALTNTTSDLLFSIGDTLAIDFTTETTDLEGLLVQVMFIAV
jgi:hypothetical protein